MKSLATLSFALLLLLAPHTYAQSPKPADAARPFVGHFFCKETGTHIYLNLYEATLTAPGFSFLGKMNGYMNGDIYGTWMLISHKIKGKKATLRFSNDIGADSQNIEFTQTSDSTYSYHAIDGNAIRKAVGRKLVKVVSDMTFRKVSEL